MKQLVEKFRSIVFKQTLSRSGNPELEFIKNRKAILRALVCSKNSENLIGINSAVLGDGMFLTAVEEIEIIGKETLVVLKPYDMSGQILQRNSLSLEEIKYVCPFNVLYKNPFFS